MVSEETKTKISNALKGRTAWNKDKQMPDGFKIKNAAAKPKKKIIQYDLQGNKLAEFPSIMQASRDLKMSSGGICDILKRRYNTYRGYTFRYKEE